MKATYPALLACFALSACSSTGDSWFGDDEKSPQTAPSSNYAVNEVHVLGGGSAIQASDNELRPTGSINHYVKYLVQDLIGNLDYANKQSVFGVTTFSLVGSDLKTAPPYAHQIAESIQHEIHMFGLPVVEFKSTGMVRVTEQGDFFMSRDYKDLKAAAPMDYVVTGTVSEFQDEVLVNAKIIGVKSMAVVASAQAQLPRSVLISYASADTIPVR